MRPSIALFDLRTLDWHEVVTEVQDVRPAVGVLSLLPSREAGGIDESVDDFIMTEVSDCLRIRLLLADFQPWQN